MCEEWGGEGIERERQGKARQGRVSVRWTGYKDKGKCRRKIMRGRRDLRFIERHKEKINERSRAD